MIKFFIVYFSFNYGVNGGVGKVCWYTDSNNMPTEKQSIRSIKKFMNWQHTTVSIDSIKQTNKPVDAWAKVTWWAKSENN
jgi:hypothetical protein